MPFFAQLVSTLVFAVACLGIQGVTARPGCANTDGLSVDDVAIGESKQRLKSRISTQTLIRLTQRVPVDVYRSGYYNP